MEFTLEKSSYLTKPFTTAVTLGMWWSPLVRLLYAAAKMALGIRPNQAAEVSSTPKCTGSIFSPQFFLCGQRGHHSCHSANSIMRAFKRYTNTVEFLESQHQKPFRCFWSLFFWLAWQVRLFTYELQGDVAMKCVGSMLSDVRMKLLSGAMKTAQPPHDHF